VTPARRCRRVDRGTNGSVAVEFAFVLPVLLMFLLGIIDMGRLAWTVSTLDFATSAAARCDAINAAPCATVALTQSYAVSQAPGMALPASDFTVSSPVCGDQVKVTAPFFYFTPWITPQNSTLTATACYPSQPS
jgi:Flp pilus assembly protein TadG